MSGCATGKWFKNRTQNTEDRIQNIKDGRLSAVVWLGRAPNRLNFGPMQGEKSALEYS